MNKICLASVVIFLSLAVAGLTQTQNSASSQELLDRAIKAMGGEAKLAALKVMTLRTKGTYFFNDKIEISFTDDWSVAEDRFRLELSGQAKGEQFQETWTINGDQGWLWESQNDKTTRLAQDLLLCLKQSLYAFRLVHRLPALKGQPFELSGLDEVKIGERLAVGLKVAQKDHPDVRLYFDKQTGLPLKSEVRVKEYDIQAQAVGDVVTLAFFFADHKDFDGLKHFSKITLKRNDRQIYETTVNEINPREKLDAGLFGKP